MSDDILAQILARLTAIEAGRWGLGWTPTFVSPDAKWRAGAAAPNQTEVYLLQPEVQPLQWVAKRPVRQVQLGRLPTPDYLVVVRLDVAGGGANPEK